MSRRTGDLIEFAIELTIFGGIIVYGGGSFLLHLAGL